MTKERAIAMIDEYLLEPNSIDAEWVEILRMSKEALREQKHGKWLLNGRCSECRESPFTTHLNYCPNCGAKMEV